MKRNRPDSSPISIHEEIFPGDTNAYGTAFGGNILALMDRAAGLAASRFAQCNVVTASLDALHFKAPVLQGEIAEVEAKVVYTSTHTCGVKVRVFSLDKTEWKRRPCCAGTIFMVAIDSDNRLLEVPEFKPRTERDKAEWDEAMAIHKRMIAKRPGQRGRGR